MIRGSVKILTCTWERMNTLLRMHTFSRVTHKWIECKHVRSGEVYLTILSTLLVLTTNFLFVSSCFLSLTTRFGNFEHSTKFHKHSTLVEDINVTVYRIIKLNSKLVDLGREHKHERKSLARDKTSAFTCTKCEGYGHSLLLS